MSGTKHRVIIDTDPGIDDTLAILLALASPDVIVEGITVTVGNNPDVLVCARNACAILEYMGRYDIPVLVGEGKPIKREFGGHSGKMIHGENGVGEITIPNPTQVKYTNPEVQGAVDFIIQKIKENEGEITIIALAPLSNIGKAIEKAPEITKLTKKIIVMGGSFDHAGNISPVAEANIYNDPEAAQLVFSAQWPSLVLIPLNLTHTIRYGAEFLSELNSIGNLAGKLASDVNQFYLKVHNLLDFCDCPLHDPTVVLYLLAPHLFIETEKVRVYVECEGKFTRGVTIADPRNKYSSILSKEAILAHGLATIIYKTQSPDLCLQLLRSLLANLP